jgi:hypothetical protein
MVSIPEEDAREIIRIVDELGKHYDDAHPEVGFGTSVYVRYFRKRVRELLLLDDENGTWED